MAKPDYTELLQAIDAAEQESYGSDTDAQLPNDRARAIDYYLGRGIAAAPEGRSQVVDRSVYETIAWILPSMTRIFANGDDVVELPPIGPEDVEPAKQEAQYLNFVLTQKNPWFQVTRDWFTDALLTKNAYVYGYHEKKRTVDIENYERQPQEGLQLLTQDSDVQVLDLKGYPSPDNEQVPVTNPDGSPAINDLGQPVMQPLMLYDVKLRRAAEKGQICVKVLPPERCKVSEKTPSFKLDECKYFEYWDWRTISDLRADGFDVEDDVSSDGDRGQVEDIARDQFGENSQARDNQIDPSMKRVKVRYVWVNYDYDEDGIAELNYCVVVGREVLFREEVSRIPVACIVPNPIPHRHIGLSIADLTMDLQDIGTALWRQGLDNLYLSNNARTAVSDKVNLDDLLVSRPGGVVRVKDGMPANEVMPLQVPFVFPQTMEGLASLDQIKEKRTGMSQYFTGLDRNALNKTATGIQTLTTAAAQRVEDIARIFASGIEDLASIVHELILKGGHRKETIRIRGNWVEIDPATWKRRTDFRISVGFAAGNKDAMVQKLMMLGNVQKEGLGIIATPQNLYETAIELAKASDFAAPQRFFTEPEKMPQQQPQPDPLIVSAQIKAQSDGQIKQLEQDTQHLQIQEQARQSDQEDMLKKYQIDKDAELKIVLEQMKGGQLVDLERHRAELNPKTKEVAAGVERTKGEQGLIAQFLTANQQQTQAIGEMLSAAVQSISQAVQAMNAPRAVIRGKDGKVTHTVPVMNGNGT